MGQIGIGGHGPKGFDGQRARRQRLKAKHRHMTSRARRGRWFGLLSFCLVLAAIAVVLVKAWPKSAVGTSGAGSRASGVVSAGDEPSAGAGAGTPISIWWVGDIAMSTQLGLPSGGLEGALARVRGLLKWGDIGTGNLEGTLSVSGPPKCGTITSTDCYSFQAPPSYASQFAALGFKMVNQANNHSDDFGAPGRSQTVRALNRAHVGHTGYPGQITYLRVKGVRIAFLGFGPWPFDSDLLNTDQDAAMVRTAKAHAQLVVVFMHDGAEGVGALHTPDHPEIFLGEDRGNARFFAHRMIEAGASVILGSGPHVIRGVEDYRGHLIAYSAGNFEGQHTLAGGGVLNDSAIVRVTLSSTGKLLFAQWVPITLVDGEPQYDRSGASIRLMAQLSASDFGKDHFAVKSNGVFDLADSPR